MTHIAEKNNVGIKTFLDILQISTLKNQILTQSNLGELLIICEDIYIYESVLENLNINNGELSKIYIIYKRSIF